MQILYYMAESPPCRSVMLLGKLIDIEFDMRIVDVFQGDQLKPDFLEVIKYKMTRNVLK